MPTGDRARPVPNSKDLAEGTLGPSPPCWHDGTKDTDGETRQDDRARNAKGLEEAVGALLATESHRDDKAYDEAEAEPRSPLGDTRWDMDTDRWAGTAGRSLRREARLPEPGEE